MLPKVSVCTPTFNRRPFIPAMLDCYRAQDYPAGLMQWIVVDDGTDPVEDLMSAAGIPNLKYVRIKDRIPLGEKRNVMHRHATGDVIVYMDDDDYYPPQRVSHAVERLLQNPWAVCAGSSILHIYFKHLDKILEFGPYGRYHATAGTFAFWRERMLADAAYDNTAVMAEERTFLKNYSVPMVQLDPKKVILVFSHAHNTFDKRILLRDRSKTIVKDTDLTTADFGVPLEAAQFFTERMHVALAAYLPGDPSLKPDAQGIRFGDKIMSKEEVLDHLNGQQRLIEALKARVRDLSDQLKRAGRA